MLDPSHDTSTPGPRPAKTRRKEPKRSKYNALLWQHFRDNPESNFKTSICTVKMRMSGKECQTEVSRTDGSTTGMKRHLERFHPDVYAKYLKEYAGDKDTTHAENQIDDGNVAVQQAEFQHPGKLFAPLKRQTSRPIETYLQEKPVIKFPLQSETQKKYDMDVMTWLARTSTPFSHVEEKGFIE